MRSPNSLPAVRVLLYQFLLPYSFLLIRFLVQVRLTNPSVP